MALKNAENVLESNPFTYRIYKNGKVSISWNNKEVLLLKGKNAKRFTVQIKNSTDAEVQLNMAKLTGNFKRGNEREGKLKGR